MASLENILNAINSATSYPHLVSRLIGLGITSYTVNVATHTTVYRQAQGNPVIHYGEGPMEPVENVFSQEKVATALQQTQAGLLSYPQFLKAIAQAGVHCYEATLTGSTKNVTYIGHRGCHVEPIPL